MYDELRPLCEPYAHSIWKCLALKQLSNFKKMILFSDIPPWLWFMNRNKATISNQYCEYCWSSALASGKHNKSSHSLHRRLDFVEYELPIRVSKALDIIFYIFFFRGRVEIIPRSTLQWPIHIVKSY